MSSIQGKVVVITGASSERAAASIPVQGARYPEQMERRTGL